MSDDHASNFFLKRPLPKVTPWDPNIPSAATPGTPMAGSSSPMFPGSAAKSSGSPSQHRMAAASHESIRLIQSDVAAYKSKLQLIFRTARAFVSQNLTKARWMILLVEHFKVVDRYLTPEDLEYIYDWKIPLARNPTTGTRNLSKSLTASVPNSHQQQLGSDTEWNFDCFITGLYDVAVRKYVDRAMSGGLKVVKPKTTSAVSNAAMKAASDVSASSSNNTSSASSSDDMKMRGTAKRVNAFKKLLQVMFDAPINVVYFNEIPLTRWNETAQIERIFHQHDKVLRKLFLNYVKRLGSARREQEALLKKRYGQNAKSHSDINGGGLTSLNRSGSSSPSKAFRSSSDDSPLPYVTYQKFIKFCTDYCFYPERIDALSIQRIFATFDDRSDCTEVKLDFSRFCDAIVRFSIMLYNREHAPGSKITPKLPRDTPVHRKLSKLFEEMSPLYEHSFERALEDDLVDLSRIGPPVLTRVDPNFVPSSGNQLVTIYGDNFDQRLGGVVIRIAPPFIESSRPKSALSHQDVPTHRAPSRTSESSSGKQLHIDVNTETEPSNIENISEHVTIVPCRFVSTGEVQCRIPPISSTSLEMKTHVELSKQPSHRDTFDVDVSNRAIFHLRASNDGTRFSSLSETDPVLFEYCDRMDPFTVEPSAVRPLRQIFTAYCQLDEPNNRTYLTVYKWKILKHEMSKIKYLRLPQFPDVLQEEPDKEVLVRRMRVVAVSEKEQSARYAASVLHSDQSRAPTPVDINDDDSEHFIELEDDQSPEFYAFAQSRPRKKLLIFEEFISMLIHFVLFNVEELHPLDFLLELAAQAHRVVPKSKTIHTIMRSSEVTSINKEIALIRVREHRCFDVYNGCVLVGTLLDEPGYVQRVGETVLTALSHKFWTYKQYDAHTLNSIMKILEFSSSFDHLLHRLLNEGFDIAAAYQDLSTREPLGRNWTIYNNFTQEKVASLWDYPGTIARMDWVPRPHQIDKSFMITVYQGTDFHRMFTLFKKAPTVQRFRELLQREKQYRIRTNLYRFA